MYAVILINNHQYKIFENSLIKINGLNFDKNSILLINDIILFNYNRNFYFNDNLNLKRIFIIARVIDHYKYKKKVIFKMKRRKRVRKLKTYKDCYTEILIEKFFIKFI